MIYKRINFKTYIHVVQDTTTTTLNRHLAGGLAAVTSWLIFFMNLNIFFTLDCFFFCYNLRTVMTVYINFPILIR